MKKTYIWRGLCTLLVLVFSLTMFGQSLAFTREGDVNLFLGTLPPARSEEHTSELQSPDRFS